MAEKVLALGSVPVIRKRIGKIDTIAKLQETDFFDLGDVVDLLGTTVAGDGGHHKRIIQLSDDGSGIRMKNGLYANYVQNSNTMLNSVLSNYKFLPLVSYKTNLFYMTKLDTPYYTDKMKAMGIYDEYVKSMDSIHLYEFNLKRSILGNKKTKIAKPFISKTVKKFADQYGIY